MFLRDIKNRSNLLDMLPSGETSERKKLVAKKGAYFMYIGVRVVKDGYSFSEIIA